MKSIKPSFAAVPIVFTVLLSSLSPVVGAGTLDAREAGLASFKFAAAQTAKQQCMNACRARYRDCRYQKGFPSSGCQNVYQDCIRFSCNKG
jgi:hypothetical protein